MLPILALILAGAAPATPERDSLMTLAFPGWKRDVNWTTAMPPPKTEIVALTLRSKSPTRHFVQPLGVIQLDAQHLAMITSTVPVDAHSGDADYGCEGSNYCDGTTFVGVYFFSRGDQGWAVSKRMDRAAKLSGSGAEKFKVEEWAGHGRVVAFSTGYGYQSGYIENLTMLALQPDQAVLLLENSPLGGGEDRVTTDPEDSVGCGEVLDPKYVQPANVSIDSGCEDTDGKWSFEGERMRLTYHWAKRESVEGRLSSLQEHETQVVLQWTGGFLKLIEGEFPELEM